MRNNEKQKEIQPDEEGGEGRRLNHRLNYASFFCKKISTRQSGKLERKDTMLWMEIFKKRIYVRFYLNCFCRLSRFRPPQPTLQSNEY
jgi:hypothetical protein